MTKNEFCELMAELMSKYDEQRAKWLAKYGTDEGFNDWFTQQVERKS